MDAYVFLECYLKVISSKKGIERQSCYHEIQKGYKLYEYGTGLMFISKDVIFKEPAFPFKDGKHYETEDMFTITLLGAINEAVIEDNHVQESFHIPNLHGLPIDTTPAETTAPSDVLPATMEHVAMEPEDDVD